jgi:hypothetical protein|tara:strand:+ start:105 stop:542 length:438 start_codon:yes stop_codon:yes gene_type:complete
MIGLTDKQEKFARLVSDGEKLTSAYRKVYNVKNTTKEKSVWEQASALASNLKVASRISALTRLKDEDHSTQVRRRSEYVLRKLQEEVERIDNRSSDKISALALLGKSVGLFTDKVETVNNTDRNSVDIEEELEKKLSELLGNKAS